MATRTLTDYGAGDRTEVAVAVSASGANVVLAAVAGKRIVLLAYRLTAAGAVNAKFQSASTDKTGAMVLAAAGSTIDDRAYDHGLLATAVGEALNLHLSGAVAVAGYAVLAVV